MARPRAENPRTKITNIRLTEEERTEFEDAAAAGGYKNISEYIRFLHAAFSAAAEGKAGGRGVNARDYPAKLLRLFHKTDLGEILWGDSRSYLFNRAAPESVDLIMTSPPFGLVRKKSYGNEDAEQYCDWFRPFAEGFRRVLKDTGSLVIDIGGAWVPGQPTRSLYHFKLLVMLVEEYGFHLCQEHYWWNPSETPHPCRMGECPPRPRQGRGELHLVAFQDSLPEGQQQARSSALQQVHAALAEEWLQAEGPAIRARHLREL